VDDPFYPLLERAPVQQDTPPAHLALEPDICAYPHHAPFVAATRMWFAQLHQIIDLYIL
jgi:hypothetical protein